MHIHLAFNNSLFKTNVKINDEHYVKRIYMHIHLAFHLQSLLQQSDLSQQYLDVSQTNLKLLSRVNKLSTKTFFRSFRMS